MVLLSHSVQIRDPTPNYARASLSTGHIVFFFYGAWHVLEPWPPYSRSLETIKFV
jgi:hypothetical protein